MAELGVLASLHAYFKGVPVKFTVEAVAEGPLEGGWVSGVSAIDFKKDLEALVRDLEYKGIAESMEKNGSAFKGMESVASYVIRKLGKKYGIRHVKVWEGPDEYAIVYAGEI